MRLHSASAHGMMDPMNEETVTLADVADLPTVMPGSETSGPLLDALNEALRNVRRIERES